MTFKWNSFLSTIKNNGNWVFVKKDINQVRVNALYIFLVRRPMNFQIKSSRILLKENIIFIFPGKFEGVIICFHQEYYWTRFWWRHINIIQILFSTKTIRYAFLSFLSLKFLVNVFNGHSPQALWKLLFPIWFYF